MKHLFISFSSRDQKIVRELMADLKHQGISFWDYSELIESIRPGNDIHRRLFDEIDRCDFFLAVISKNSVDESIGRFCIEEVDYARKNGFAGQGRFIPLMLKPDEPESLESPFDVFNDLMQIELLTGNNRSWVEAVQRICLRLDIHYVPPVEAHSQMPFRDEFRKEVKAFAQSNSRHTGLLTLLGEFNRAFREGDYQHALFLISHFIQSCRYTVPDYHILFPFLVKGVCEALLGEPEAALESYREALRSDPDNPDALGGMGNAFFQLEEYQKAEEAFRHIIEKIPEQSRNAGINLIITRLMAGKVLQEADKAHLLELNLEDYPSDLQTSVMKAISMLYLKEGNFEGVNRMVGQMIDEDRDDTVIWIIHYLAHYNAGYLSEAEDILGNAIERARSTPRLRENELVYRLVELQMLSGETMRALSTCEDHLMKLPDTERKRHAIYACLLMKKGKRKESQKQCRSILHDFGLPSTREDFYFAGWANHLLGNNERARYDFERSSGYGIPYPEWKCNRH